MDDSYESSGESDVSDGSTDEAEHSAATSSPNSNTKISLVEASRLHAHTVHKSGIAEGWWCWNTQVSK